MKGFYILLSILLLGVMFCQRSQTAPGKMQIVQQDEKIMLIGETPPDSLWEYFPEWKADFMLYEPDSANVSRGKNIERDLQILCYHGTWCHDSKIGVPGFVKFLESVANTRIKWQLIGLDRNLDEPGNSQKYWKISKVPTFIILENGREIGRMVETPKNTFEADFLEIVLESEKR
ncbi:MAG: hypothetical protein Kow0037_26500 [Calditrichia bacterium]